MQGIRLVLAKPRPPKATKVGPPSAEGTGYLRWDSPEAFQAMVAKLREVESALSMSLDAGSRIPLALPLARVLKEAIAAVDADDRTSMGALDKVAQKSLAQRRQRAEEEFARKLAASNLGGPVGTTRFEEVLKEVRPSRFADPRPPRPSEVEQLRSMMEGWLLIRRGRRGEPLAPDAATVAQDFVVQVSSGVYRTLAAQIREHGVAIDAGFGLNPLLVAAVAKRFKRMMGDRRPEIAAPPKRRRKVAQQYVINGFVAMGCPRQWAKDLFAYAQRKIRRKARRSAS